ncbi:MAG: hypothetical protein DI527_16480 [Chelatococcus sp.]|nr:MAG: hypothetical protein DI527_16480 [Chelatococcus sp.]
MSDYIGVVTTAGQVKIAASIGGAALNLTTIRVGDGNGAPITPIPGMADLVRRVGNAYPILSAGPDPVNSTHWRISTLIPVEDGPFDIREIGVFDSAGTMIAIAKHVLVEKRTPAQGAAVELVTDIVFPVSETAQVTVALQPTASVSIFQMLRAGFTVVESATTTAAPGAPALGRTHVVPVGATGAWAGLAGSLVQWTGAVWVAANAPIGFVVVDQSRALDHPARYLRRSADGWVSAAAATDAYGFTRLATVAEAKARESNILSVTPAGLGDVLAEFGFRTDVSTKFAPALPYVDAYASATINLPTSASAKLTFQTLTGALLGTNTWDGSRLTIGPGMGGNYYIQGAWTYFTPADGTFAATQIRRGPSNIIGEGDFPYNKNGGGTLVEARTIARLGVGDYIEVDGYHQSGSTQPAYADPRARFFAVLLSAI